MTDEIPAARGPSSPRTDPAEPIAFRAFYEAEFGSIAVVAGAIVGNRMAGEDIAQEALTRASEQWDVVGQYDKPGAWVRRVAINLALNGKRRRANEQSMLQRLIGGSPTVTETRSGDPEVWDAIRQLPPRQRAAVALHYLEDRPVAEVAEIMEIAVSTTTTNLQKARTNLARILGDQS